jgi:hypothetical protein
MVCTIHEFFFSLCSRTFLSIIGGSVAGIWGFTGLMGFVSYFLIMMAASVGLLAKSKFSVETYFDSWSRISIEGVFGGLMVRTFCCLVVVDILWTLICSLQSYSLYCPSYAIYTLKHNTLIHVPRKPEFYLGVI